ncbi:MAG: ATP-binding protein [Dehalococcoidia bacterium]|nr:ATP-binding protein [Dehalococcoidia bacterium]
MFKLLRFRLAFLYLCASLLLVLLIGGGSYGLLKYYFQTTTDLALQHKMASVFGQLGASLPPELAAASREWDSRLNRSSFNVPATRVSSPNGSEKDQDDSRHLESDDSREEDTYDGELATVFVLSLNEEGKVVFDPNLYPAPIAPDKQAIEMALERGSDWRTLQVDNMRIRLLTYRLGRSDGPALLQVGRVLSDQDRLLNQLLMGLLAIGGGSSLLLGAGSWWLAGRSLLRAQKVWERQQSFVANASHELRTPLTLLRASAEIALRHVTPEDTAQSALMQDVLGECDYMARLIDDLLLLSRLDSGRLPLERQAIPLPGLLADVQRQVGRIAEEKGIRLTAEGDGTAVGDPGRLRQVLLILLDNALRHTPPGGSITLTARVRGQRVHLVVADTGTGIGPEHLPNVFDRFYRASSSPRDDGDSSGLGLAIAKALIEAQHGEIRLESKVGEGTRVNLLLPAM